MNITNILPRENYPLYGIRYLIVDNLTTPLNCLHCYCNKPLPLATPTHPLSVQKENRQLRDAFEKEHESAITKLLTSHEERLTKMREHHVDPWHQYCT